MSKTSIEFSITGNDIQVVEFTLNPNQSLIGEAGAMLYADKGVEFKTLMGDGTAMKKNFLSNLLSIGTADLNAESVFVSLFTNKTEQSKKIAFSAPYPGRILPIYLNDCIDNTIYVQKDSFLCSERSTKLSIYFNQKVGSGMVGSEGYILKKISGTEPAFVHVGGAVIERELDNETITIALGCLVAYEEGVSFEIEHAQNIKSMLFGGDELYLAQLKGKGRVWLQSMPIRKLVQIIAPYSKNTNTGFGISNW